MTYTLIIHMYCTHTHTLPNYSIARPRNLDGGRANQHRASLFFSSASREAFRRVYKGADFQFGVHQSHLCCCTVHIEKQSHHVWKRKRRKSQGKEQVSLIPCRTSVPRGSYPPSFEKRQLRRACRCRSPSLPCRSSGILGC